MFTIMALWKASPKSVVPFLRSGRSWKRYTHFMNHLIAWHIIAMVLTVKCAKLTDRHGYRTEIVREHLRDEHEDCRTSIETNTFQIGEHVREHIDFVTHKFDILHVQMFNLCVTILNQTITFLFTSLCQNR